MSLLTELESRGVTAEDLEKAASVRLFEKAAAAEDVDLGSLDENQVEDLYVTFLSNQSNDDYTKEASAMNDEIVDLFEKTAAAEGIDLDDMADHELAELYNHYVENVLPEQVEEYEKGASYEVDEATEKLAEAEILGRHMARAYMDEFDKEAASAAAAGARLDAAAAEAGRWGQSGKVEAQNAANRAKESIGRGYESAKAKGKAGYEAGVRGAKATGAAVASGARSYGNAMTGKQLREAVSTMRKQKGGYRSSAMGRGKALRGGAKTLAAWGATGAAGYGAKKGYDRMTKKSSIDEIIEDRANELLGEFLFESGVELD